MKKIKQLVDGDTLFVLLNLLTKSFLILVLPAVGAYFLGEMQSLKWVLFINFVSLATLFDMGLSAIVSRHITNSEARKSNTLEVVRNARRIYALIALVSIPVFYGFSIYSSPEEKLTPLLVLPVIAAPIYVLFNYRYAALLGFQQVAYANLIQAGCGGAAYLIAALALILESPEVAGVLVFIGLISPAFVFKPRLDSLLMQSNGTASVDRTNILANESVRAAIGVAASLLVYNFMSYFYSNKFYEDSYLVYMLLLFQVLRGGASFAQAPFYSKIPKINLLYANGAYKAWLDLSKMLALRVVILQLLFSIGVLAAIFQFKNDVFNGVGAFGFVLAIALIAERIAAMMMQTYTASGIVIWHKVNGVSGIVQMLACVCLYDKLQEMVFPLALLLTSVLFQIPLLFLLIQRKYQEVARLEA